MRDNMMNKRMQKKLDRHEAVDVSSCPRTKDGDFLLENFTDDVDYCDSFEEVWIWSIGRAEGDSAVEMRDGTTQILKRGAVLASTSGKFYQAPGWECLFLR
jgi:hypothetical protein